MTDSLLTAAFATGAGALSRQQQLLARLKQAILDGRLPANSRLPSSRTFSEELQVARNTVLAVYEQLTAEGYTVADRQGTRVAPLLALASAVPAVTKLAKPVRPPAVSPQARRVATMQASRHAGDRSLPLTPGMPALNRFPMSAWLRSYDRALRQAPPSVLGYGEPMGEPALREAIAHYLRVSRGVRCDAAQVVVTEGAQGALALCVRLFSNPGELAWMEDPGYGGARAVFHTGDLEIATMPVDEEGIVIPAQAWRKRPARLIHVTPSHQYPTGAVLSLVRRLDLIARAREAGSWIIEDDYDSEFRHRGQPIAAMQGLVPDAPVLYVGTFSKTMFPALRIGFLVVPEPVSETSMPVIVELLRGGHRLEQLALADFIDSGQFSAHLGKMRRLYRVRQQALREALATYLKVPHDVRGGESGLHLTARLPMEIDDREVSELARRNGMNIGALSSFSAAGRTAGTNGLVLGYGNTSEDQFATLIRRLQRLLAHTTRS